MPSSSATFASSSSILAMPRRAPSAAARKRPAPAANKVAKAARPAPPVATGGVAKKKKKKKTTPGATTAPGATTESAATEPSAAEPSAAEPPLAATSTALVVAPPALQLDDLRCCGACAPHFYDPDAATVARLLGEFHRRWCGNAHVRTPADVLPMLTTRLGRKAWHDLDCRLFEEETVGKQLERLVQTAGLDPRPLRRAMVALDACAQLARWGHTAANCLSEATRTEDE